MAKHRRPPRARAHRWRSGVLVIALTAATLASVRLVWAGIGPGASAAQLGSASGSHRQASGNLPAKIAGAVAPGSGVVSHAGQARSHQVPGHSITAIGDSVMVAATPALEHDLPGISVNAVVGRQFSTGLQVLAGLRQSGQLRRIVVFALGTNGPVTAGQIAQLFTEIGPHRLLVLVNTFEARSWEHEVNAALAAAAGSHPQVVLANWFAAIEHRTSLLWPDGIHPQPAGGMVYARVVTAAVEAVASSAG